MIAERTIDTMTKPTGRPPGRPKGSGEGRQVVTVSVSLTPEERKTLTEVCAEMGITQSDFVRLALRHAAVLAALHKESK
jgi:hypothetical protein